MKNNSKAIIAISAVFILGNAVIITPFVNSNKFAFLAFLVAMVISFTVYFLFFLLPVNKVTIAPIILLCFYCMADAFITLIRFINYDLSLKKALILLPILAIFVFVSLQKTGVLLKLSLFFLPFCLSIILLFFLSTAKDFNIKNIFIYELPSFNSLFMQVLPFIKTVVLPMGVLSLFVRGEKAKLSAGFCGALIGFCALAVCILNSVLLFGISFAGDLEYAYSLAGSTVTFGNLFTRMDGLLYFLYLASVISKCGLAIAVIKKSRSVLAP